MTPLTSGGRCQLHRWPVVGGVNYTADQWWAVSITPLTSGGWCQWHRWLVVGGVNNTADQGGRSGTFWLDPDPHSKNPVLDPASI
jgi:hypothetical protein